MKTKILSIALIASVISIKAQQMQTRPSSAFNKVETRGSVNVIYTFSDTTEVKVDGDAKEIENVETKFENSTLIINNKSTYKTAVYVYVKNNQLTEVQSSGASSFKTTNAVKTDSINFSLSGAAGINAMVESRSIKCIQSGASDLKLSGKATNLQAELSGASSLKAYDLTADRVTVSTSGASTAKIFATEKLNANATGASNIKIKGDAKDISAEATTAASIEKAKDPIKIEKKSGNDSLVLHWRSKKIIIIDGEKKEDEKGSAKDSLDHFNHWAGFSMGVNGYMGANGNIGMPTKTNYMDLNYGRSFNFQFNLFERHINIVKNNFKIVTGFGFDYHSYAFNRNTNLNPNTDSLSKFASVDTSNAYTYKKNKFRNTYIQIPLLLEFNTSNNPNKSFHIAFGVIGEYLISSRTKQKLEQNTFEFTKEKKDGYNLSPFAAKAHVNIGYKGFTAFGEYNLTPMFQSGKGPELYPFTIGVRLVPFS